MSSESHILSYISEQLNVINMSQNTFIEINHKLILPNVSERLGISSPEYFVREIFKGGMGTCAKIVSEDGQFFALKIIHINLIQDQSVLQRYVEEMKTWLTLSACNGVVEAFCLTRINNIPCIVAKWMDKGNLRPFISQSNSELFYKSIDRIVSTLEWAFTNYSIIHRDLKPENILIDQSFNAFVADWGLSRPISKPSSENSFDAALSKHSNRLDITEAGSYLGTILYSSPEQILGLNGIDHRSDIYSLGCIMYEWEAGRPPFVASTAQEIALKHLHEKPKRLGGFLKSTNFNVEKIIEKCLEKDPGKRYQTYGELKMAFHEVAAKKPSFKKFSVTELYKIPLIGGDEFIEKLKDKEIKAVYSENGRYAIIDQRDINQYLDEGENLIALGEYEKAKNIFEVFFVYDLFKKIPDSTIVQYFCVNYALSLLYLGEIEKGISVLRTIDEASSKPVQYYLNLSLLYLQKNEYQLAENICKEGMKVYQNDNELIGNLTIALSHQEKLEEALESAKKRFAISKNVNSLEEIANVIYKFAESQKNTEFPTAIKNYRIALTYLQEAKQLNPNFHTARLSISNILFKLRRYGESTVEAFDVLEMSKSKNIAEIAAFYISRNLLWSSSFEDTIKFCNKHMSYHADSVFLKRVLSETYVDGYVIDKYRNGVKIVEESSLAFFTTVVDDEKKRLPSDFRFLARIHAWMGDVENINHAISILSYAVELYPSNWQLDFTLSAIYREHEFFDEALEEALSAKEKAPWREKVYFLISNIYKDKGDLVNAKVYEQEGIRLKNEKLKLYG
jgi:serine/threonine protein kinase/Flp pilus assembly protein TadD